MLAYVIRRLLLLVPVLVGVSVVSFALLQLVPGDPALILAGEEATEEVLTRIRQEYGLNRPLPVQFLAYLRHAVVGDLGVSIQSRQPVSTLLKQRFPFTLKLAFLAILVSAILGVVGGVVRRDRSHHACLDARGATPGLRADGARQGRLRPPRRLSPRPWQRHDPDPHRLRPRIRLQPGRRCPH